MRDPTHTDDPENWKVRNYASAADGASDLTNSRASLGLRRANVRQRSIMGMARPAPVHRLDGDLLVHELAALLKDEVAALRLASLARTQSGDQDTLRIGQERVGQVFLEMHT